MNIDPFVFLINTFFKIYIFIVLLRFLMQWMGADFFNPVAQFVVKVTKPILNPLRKILPSTGHFDLASLFGMIVLQALYGYLMTMLHGGQVNPVPLLIWSVGELIDLVLNTFVILIIVQAVLSWINPGVYNPAIALVHSITNPVLSLGRRVLPPISGIDLSPILVVIALEFLRRLIIPFFEQAIMTAQPIAL
ncbi:MAG: YggT family protein [Gammaproteobacteria bacterium]|nr:YggT family protein [Gammaproteobacteria bacterium]